MPKEYVKGSEPIRAEPAGPDDRREPIGRDQDGNPLVETVEGLVSVGWANGLEHVQVSTVTRDTVSFDTVTEGPYVNLNRYGINQLIRRLRQARDQAFGRDE